MTAAVVPIAPLHAASFRAALDIVAREKKYLAMVEAPPLEQVQSFVAGNVERGVAQVVAVEGDRVLGWADIVPAAIHGVAHRASLGMGVLSAYRGLRVGRALLAACITKAWANGLTRVDLRGARQQPTCHRALQGARIPARGREGARHAHRWQILRHAAHGPAARSGVRERFRGASHVGPTHTIGP